MSTAAGIVSSAVPAMTHARTETRDFLVEGWLVQPARNRMVKGATAVRVRPQLIDVLTCLAKCPGRVVPKDQLLAEVWCDRFVSESGVARCVAELRQLLADDAKHPRIIETIPKRGYRVIAPVEWLVPPAQTGFVSNASGAPVLHSQAPAASPGRLLRLLVAQRWIAPLVTGIGMFLRDHSRTVFR